jgi:iron complex outermembrane recepter protein
MKKLTRSDRSSVAVDAFVKRSLRSVRMRARLRTSAVTVGLALSVGSAAALADEPAKADDVQLLEEIVVTAQFREQGLQTTPVAITAVTASQLEQRELTEVTDLNGIAPNLVIAKGTNTNGPSAQMFIRGVGQSDGHPGLEPGVGLYVDDVYRGLLLGSDLDLTDLDRVEVLRGPQGTLSGKNSLGGSLKLFSKKPSDQTDGYVEATYGDFNRIDLRAGGNFTLIPDTLYARVSGSSKQVDGYMTRLDYACEHPGTSQTLTQIPVSPGGCKLGTEGGEDVHAVRVALRWIVNDSIENNFIADATKDNSEIPALKLTVANNTQRTVVNGQQVPFIPNGGSQYITPANSYTTYATFVQPGFTDPTTLLGQPGAGTHGAVALPTTDPINAYGLSDNITWKLADNYTLTSISGYRRYIGSYSIEVGGSPVPAQLLDDTWAERQFTQEVRLNGTTFEKWDWTFGGYFYNEFATFGGLKMLNPGTFTPAPAGSTTSITGASGETLFTGNDPITSQSTSVFLHNVYHLTEQLNLIGGIRYTKEHKDYTFERLNPYDPALPSYNAVAPLNNTTGFYHGSHVDYRAGAEYQWTDSLMTYAQWSTGFRGGGVNPRPFVPAEEVPFGQETVHATEVGIKSDFFDHHVRVNVAGFYNEYQNILFVNSLPITLNGVSGIPNSTPVNVGSAHIKGAELEVEARPWGGLQIDASASYLDFNFTSINGTGIQISGVTLNNKEPYAPSAQASVGLQYVFTMGTAGSITPRVDAQYQSSFFTDIQNSWQGEVGGRTLMDARLTWKSQSQDWETSAAVTNLTDRFYYINKVFGAPPTNITEGQPGAPREWLVTVRRNF